MTLTPEHTFTRSEVRDILARHLEEINPVEEIKDWSIEELAEEAQNPSYYDHKDEFLRAISYHPRGGHILVQLALASNEDLPSDVVDLLIKISPYASVVETLIAVHRMDDKVVQRAREAVESIHALSASGTIQSQF